MRGARIALTVVSLLILGLSGYAWATLEGLRDGMTLADVIGSEGGGEQPADGAVDILLVGMDSRTDAQGNPLPKKMLRKLRAGPADGALNTDTLILLHIPNNGKKATAISIPRDSYVNIPGYGRHKINSAYARAKMDARERLREEENITDKSELEVRANQEGAKTLIATLQNLTGNTIDHYAEVNLLGFSKITQAVGGVQVCLKNAVSEPRSGAHFRAGEQTISGADALAFVRQRHGLPRGDLDRIVRQQVFMAGLARKIVSTGTLTDQSKLQELMRAIKKSVVLDQQWDIMDFASRMKELAGGQINFRTIPYEDIALDTPDGEAIEVDPDEVAAFVDSLTGGGTKPGDPQPSPSETGNGSVDVNVFNTTNLSGLAAQVAGSLSDKGFGTGTVGNAEPRTSTVVRHAPGEQAVGRRVASALEGQARVEPDENLAQGTVSVLLGSDYQGPEHLTGGNPLSLDGPARRQPADEEQPPEGGGPKITSDGIRCVN